MSKESVTGTSCRLHASNSRTRKGSGHTKPDPKCIIDRDYARPLRRNLTEDISWLEEGEELEMTFSFDGRVLTIDSGARRVHEVVASGDSWPTSYRAVVTPDSKLPARFETYWVEVNVFEGHLCWDRLPLAPCEPVA